MAWLKLIVRIAAGGPGALEDTLENLGAVSVTTVGDSEQPVFELAPGEPLTWDRCELHALFPPEFDIRSAMEVVRGDATRAQRPDFDVEFVASDGWVNAWRQHAAHTEFADRLWLIPRDAEVDARPDQAVLRLDPGMAFGTGTHPTTFLCLTWLAEQSLDGLCVLDYGCGSGVLAIGAALLGAKSVIAIDHDPQALLATGENAAYNAVVDSLRIDAPETLHSPCGADVVLANILANPLVELAPELIAHTRSSGSLVLSGLLAEQAEFVAGAYPGFDFQKRERDGWILLAGSRRG